MSDIDAKMWDDLLYVLSEIAARLEIIGDRM